MRAPIFLSLCVAFNIKSHHCLPAREVTRTCEACVQTGNKGFKAGLSFADSESRVEETRWGPETQIFGVVSLRGPNAKVIGDFDDRTAQYGVSLAHIQVGDNQNDQFDMDFEVGTAAVELGYGFMGRVGAMKFSGRNEEGRRSHLGVNLDTGIMVGPKDFELKVLGLGGKVGYSGIEICIFVCWGAG